MQSRGQFGAQAGVRVFRKVRGLGSEGATWEGAGRRVLHCLERSLMIFSHAQGWLGARGGPGNGGLISSTHSSAYTGADISLNISNVQCE